MTARAFFQAIGVEKPVFIGASDGGMDANTLKSLKRKYFLAPLMLWYMKHCDYEKLKPSLIKAGMRHIRNESAEEIACAQDMIETIFKDYKQEKDVHISSLLADLMRQKPVTAADFADLAGKILLILPNQDSFTGKMQEDLIRLMHNPAISYVSGGHLSTVLKPDDYMEAVGCSDRFGDAVTQKLLHIVTTSRLESIFEIIRHGMSRTEASEYIALLSRYHRTGFLAIFGGDAQ